MLFSLKLQNLKFVFFLVLSSLFCAGLFYGSALDINFITISSSFTFFIGVLISYFIGYCAVGLPVICFVPILYGFSVGNQLSQIYSNFSGFDFLYVVLFVAVQTIFLLLLLLANREATKLSLLIFSEFVNKDRKKLNIQIFKLYNLKFAVILSFGFINKFINYLIDRLLL